MTPDVRSFLNFQISRSTRNGATDEAMAYMRQFLELQREQIAQEEAGKRRSEREQNVVAMPLVRALS